MRLLTGFLLGLCMLGSTEVFAVSSTDSLHLDWLDKSVDPSKDFFEYANGGWKKKNPIPAAYPSWNNFSILQERNQLLIKNLIETAAHQSHSSPGNIEQKVGDFYFSGMDEATINKVGTTPLQPEFKRINDIKNTNQLQQVVTHLQMLGVGALFDFGQMQDYQDSRQVIGVAGQGGLGLPDRDYYLKNDKKFQRIREAYLVHIKKMFMLLGDDTKKASIEAKTVLTIETALAKSSMSRIDMRDPHAVYHPMKISELQKTTPDFSWSQYFNEVGHPEIKQINLATPDFFKSMNEQLKTVSLDDWKIYLRWHLVHAFTPFLSTPFVKEGFHMTSVLTGVEKQLPRWKRVVNAENGALGFAIGKMYVEKTFPPSSKKQVTDIINHIRVALENDLQHIDWMTPETREAALKKLKEMGQRVGYPDKWWDYSKLTIDRGPYVLNIMRASEFINERELNKIGKPLDETEWDMTPQTVNAYYDPSMNRLNIPAGILQPPFFDPKAPAAINYGAIGFVIGHEMTHGFDDQGAQFDGAGNLKNWWSKEDLKKFQTTTQQIATQFSQYKVNGNVGVQGKLVMGEATADLGGLILALSAYHASADYKQAKDISHFTPDQQFFLGAAHVWASKVRPAEAERLVLIDPHPPAKFRVNGTFANMPQFKLAYGIKNNSPMVNQQCPVIW